MLANRADFNAEGLALRVADVILEAALAPAAQSPSPAASAPAADLTRYTGSYRSTRAGTVLSVRFDEDAQALVIHHPSGLVFPMLAEGSGRFRTADSAPFSLTAIFDEDETGTGRLTLQAESQPPTVHLAFTLAEPTPAALEAYAGRYVSDELRATYHLMITEEGLVLTLGYDPRFYPLQPAGEDEFSARGSLFRFVRAADGRVSGFQIRAGRVDNIGFRRT